MISFDAQHCDERELRTPAEVDELRQIVERNSVTWINVAGLGDADVVGHIGRIFNLHPLALEDVLNSHQRSKVEQYGDHLFIIARMVEGGEKLETDQLAIFLGQKFIVTFQHTVGDCFDALRERIRQGAASCAPAGPTTWPTPCSTPWSIPTSRSWNRSASKSSRWKTPSSTARTASWCRISTP